MEMSGDLLSHEFIIERDGHTVATVSERWLSLTDSRSTSPLARPTC